MIERQFTATVYIVLDQKVLLHRHPKLGKWLPPGGHVEENELPPECAKREAFEETGLIVELFQEEHLHVAYPNANSFERPFLCLLENIPSRPNAPAHQHIDFIYVGYPVGGELSDAAVAETQARWFALEEALALTPEGEIFAETQETISTLFQCLDKGLLQQKIEEPLPKGSGFSEG